MTGSTSRTPGPLTPVNRPNVNMTPRSYSFSTRIELMTSSSSITTMMGNERLIADSLLILLRFHPERQLHHFDYTGLLARAQWTCGAGVPQLSAIAYDAPIPTIADRFNGCADHRLDPAAQRPAPRSSRQPADGDDDESAGNGDSRDQGQCYPQSRSTIVEKHDGTDDECRESADAQRAECGHEELRDDQTDPERHESETRVVDLQQLQPVKPQQQ